MLLQTFRRDSTDDVDEQNTNDNCNIFEKKIFDRLIVIDNVLGLTDKSNDFSIFWLFFKSLAASLCIYLYYLPEKIYLADDSVADRDF